MAANEYCYRIISPKNIDENARNKIENYLMDSIYRNNALEGSFSSTENVPINILFSKQEGLVCAKMTSRGKANRERIEKIHEQLKEKLNVGDGIVLGKPSLYTFEQCEWWGGDCKLGEKIKWRTLRHNGPYFSHLMEPYIPHKAPLVYDGKDYVLTPKEEKVANFYARRLISETNPNITIFHTKDPAFNRNFWTDFKTYLTPQHKKIFKLWSKVDFSKIVNKLTEIKESETKEDKRNKAIKSAERKHNYGLGTINGKVEPVGNYVVELSGIFYGRGKNPKRGKIKRDIEPEDVVINISGKAPPPPRGHKWGSVIHDQKLSWLASWKDPITEDSKYIFFAAEGQLKGKSDLLKYEKARKLNKFIDIVRKKYQRDIDSQDFIKRQLGTVLYLIDHYGLRVGGEKSAEESGTLGASTLKVNNIKMKPPNMVIFDFIGKDSIPYYKEIEVSKRIYQNISDFIKGKKGTDSLFDKISAADINAYLKTFDVNFTAKVFRTRLASSLMYRELENAKVRKQDDLNTKLVKYNKANAEVAQVLNHQRTVSKKAKEQVVKYKEDLKKLTEELKQRKKDGKATKGIENRISTKERQIALKSDTLSVAIATSRTNYIDPRIVVSWSLVKDFPLDKAYTPALRKKFKWAIDTTTGDWNYIRTPLPSGMDTLEPIGEQASAKKVEVRPQKIAKSVVASPVVRPRKISKPPGEKIPARVEHVQQISSLIKFYLGEGNQKNLSIKDILSWKEIPRTEYSVLFSLFPNDFTLSEIKYFRNDDTLRDGVKKVYKKIVELLGYNVDIQREDIKVNKRERLSSNRNNIHLVSQLLSFLNIIDLRKLSYLFILGLCLDLKSDKAFNLWVNTRNGLKGWLKVMGVSDEVIQNYDTVNMRP